MSHLFNSAPGSNSNEHLLLHSNSSHHNSSSSRLSLMRHTSSVRSIDDDNDDGFNVGCHSNGNPLQRQYANPSSKPTSPPERDVIDDQTMRQHHQQERLEVTPEAHDILIEAFRHPGTRSFLLVVLKYVRNTTHHDVGSCCVPPPFTPSVYLSIWKEFQHENSASGDPKFYIQTSHSLFNDEYEWTIVSTKEKIDFVRMCYYEAAALLERRSCGVAEK